MHTLRLQCKKIDIESVLITVGMAFMEATGMVLLICGIFGIKPF